MGRAAAAEQRSGARPPTQVGACYPVASAKRGDPQVLRVPARHPDPRRGRACPPMTVSRGVTAHDACEDCAPANAGQGRSPNGIVWPFAATSLADGSGSVEYLAGSSDFADMTAPLRTSTCDGMLAGRSRAWLLSPEPSRGFGFSLVRGPGDRCLPLRARIPVPTDHGPPRGGAEANRATGRGRRPRRHPGTARSLAVSRS
jgi:hypothetical protein